MNWLHDDPEGGFILAGLLHTNVVHVTGLNISEVLATEEVRRRVSLLKLLQRLADSRSCLTFPNEYLKQILISHANGDSERIRASDRRLALLLDDLARGTERSTTSFATLRRENRAWKKELEDSFAESHRNARPAMQQFYGSGKGSRPNSWLVFYRNSQRFIRDQLSRIYRQATGQRLTDEAARELLNDLPELDLYFAGWAHQMYERTVRECGFGRKGKPGTVDLWCAIYLPLCDCFVTHDKGQYSALLALNALNKRRSTEILLYEDFRARLLIGAVNRGPEQQVAHSAAAG